MGNGAGEDQEPVDRYTVSIHPEGEEEIIEAHRDYEPIPAETLEQMRVIAGMEKAQPVTL